MVLRPVLGTGQVRLHSPRTHDERTRTQGRILPVTSILVTGTFRGAIDEVQNRLKPSAYVDPSVQLVKPFELAPSEKQYQALQNYGQQTSNGRNGSICRPKSVLDDPAALTISRTLTAKLSHATKGKDIRKDAQAVHSPVRWLHYVACGAYP